MSFLDRLLARRPHVTTVTDLAMDDAELAAAFTVTAVEQHRRTRIPLDKYFARDGTPRLTLIIRGSPFDKATRHYRDNITVTAAKA